MAKKKEQLTAEKYYIELLKTPEEIAELLDVSARTVREWINKYNWKAIRDARLNNTGTRAENIKKVIADITENSLNVLSKILIAEQKGDKGEALLLKKESTRLSQEVGMWQKALEKMDKDFKISLSTYLEIMDDIFNALQSYDNELYLKTLDFQRAHLQSVAQKHA